MSIRNKRTSDQPLELRYQRDRLSGRTDAATSHALVADGDAWVIDLVDTADLDDRLGEVGDTPGGTSKVDFPVAWIPSSLVFLPVASPHLQPIEPV